MTPGFAANAVRHSVDLMRSADIHASRGRYVAAWMLLREATIQLVFASGHPEGPMYHFTSIRLAMRSVHARNERYAAARPAAVELPC